MRTLQECNEITVKHRMILHVIVMISKHVPSHYGVAFLIWLIVYLSILCTHALVINSVEVRFIFRVGLFNALPWSRIRMSSSLQVCYYT